MKKLLFYGTIASGAIAAYLMYRRGEPIGSIARKAMTNPIGSFANEMKNAF